MSEHMTLQTVAASKLPLALGADEGNLVGVGDSMAIEMLSSSEGSTAAIELTRVSTRPGLFV